MLAATVSVLRSEREESSLIHAKTRTYTHTHNSHTRAHTHRRTQTHSYAHTSCNRIGLTDFCR